VTPRSAVVWIITRHELDGTAEPLAATRDKTEAQVVVEALGEGHSCALAALPAELEVPMLVPGGGHRVIAWWRCRAVVRDGEVEIGEPHRVLGAARVLLPGEVVEVEQRVREDVQAGELEQAVHGLWARFVETFALTAKSARALAEQWAETAAAQAGH
jgi:hypothetical protein